MHKVNILVGDLYKTLFGNQAGYLRPMKRMDICIEQAGTKESDKRAAIEGRNMNYKSLIFRIEYCSCKLFFPH